MNPRLEFAATVLALVGASVFLVAQVNDANDNPKGFSPESRIESSQGQASEADVIGNKYLSKGTRMKCIQVEHHPKQADDGTACVARFEGYARYTLKFGETMRAPRDSDVYVECAGDKPTRCTIGVW